MRSRESTIGLFAAALCLALAAAPAAADDAPALIRARQTVPRVVAAALIRYSQALSGSIAAGMIVTRADAADQCNVLCDLSGPVLQLEVGRDGTQLAFGWGWVVAETTEGHRFLRRTHLGYSVKGVWVRTGGHSRLSDDRENWAGVEGSISAVGLHFSLAALHGAPDAASPNEWRFSGAIGWGF